MCATPASISTCPGVPGYVDKQLLYRTADEYKALARADIKRGSEVYYKAGDTLEILPENTYYRVEYQDRETKEKFVLYPSAQVNEQMGGLLASPDIKKFADHDIYSHISAVPPIDKEKDWSEVKEHVLSVGDTIFLNDYFAVFRGVEPAHQTAGLGLTKDDLAIQGDFLVYGEKKQYHVHPVFVVRNRLIGRVPDEIEDLGLRLSFLNVDPQGGKFTFGVSTTQKDYIILKAVEKPFINLLWSGTLLMAVGFGMALYKRRRENRSSGRCRARGWQPAPAGGHPAQAPAGGVTASASKICASAPGSLSRGRLAYREVCNPSGVPGYYFQEVEKFTRWWMNFIPRSVQFVRRFIKSMRGE